MNTDQIILYAEDDESDAFLFKHAFKQAGIEPDLFIVPSGKAAIAYLSSAAPYNDRAKHPTPVLVLLDLNMPGISGLEVLKWIRTTPSVCRLITIVLTSSNQDRDIHRAYTQGANDTSLN